MRDGADQAVAKPEAKKKPWYGVITLVLVVLTAFLFGLMVYAERDARLLAAEGVSAAGLISDRYRVEKRSDNSSSRRSTDHYLTVRYPVADGTEVERDFKVGEDTFAARKAGDRIEVLYAVSRPKLAEIEPGRVARDAALIRWVVMGSGVLTLVFGALFLRERNRAKVW